MRSVLLSLILAFSGLKLKAQDQLSRTEVDTLSRFEGKILVNYKTYENSALVGSAEAFLYPIHLKIPKYRLLGNLIQTEIKADSIVYHGRKISYSTNRSYKVEEYNNGAPVKNPLFYNSKGKEIKEQEFIANKNIKGPCGEIPGIYFITGKRK